MQNSYQRINKLTTRFIFSNQPDETHTSAAQSAPGDDARERQLLRRRRQLRLQHVFPSLPYQKSVHAAHRHPLGQVHLPRLQQGAQPGQSHEAPRQKRPRYFDVAN